MSEPLVSVIIPVYKVEPYLRPCADSVLAQTYKNLEILLVDDGSPDTCPQICDEYAKKDPRVRVIHKENGGLSDARNAALDIARGDYVGFVDSDDWIAPTMYEELVKSALKLDADIAVCGYTESNGVRDLEVKSLAPAEKSYTVEEAFREVLLTGEILVIMCNKLYKRELFDRIRFPKGELFEDGDVFYRLFGRSRRLAHTGGCGYFYRKRAGSITFKKFEAIAEPVVSHAADLAAYIRAHYPGLERELKCYKAETDYYLAVKYLQGGGDVRSETFKKLRDTLRAERSVIRTHPRWGWLKKAKVQLILTGAYAPVRAAYHRFKNR